MKRIPHVSFCLLLVALTAPLVRALSDAEAAAGRLTLRRYADAVVVVKATVVLKVSYGDRTMPPREDKVEVNGTMISSKGLTVTSLSQIDPAALFEAMRGQMAQQGAGMELTQSEVKDIKLRLADGAEIPARVVWKDAIHDLALLGPTGAVTDRAFTFVPLDEAPEAASLLGTYFLVSRTSEAMLRTAVVQPATIIGIIERPRRMILLSGETPGCPAFDAQGRVLGICVHYVSKSVPVGSVLVPAADVVSAANQAATAN
jgi:hypothetical protein